ncbi:MAG TPA: hypothetical protein VK892_18910 [Pyrinomonadaceae bacterium]|nr:hypothetical protein [Pyrinomonadaceae bacterium]
MARKKRKIQEPELPVNDPKKKTVYRDSFQEGASAKIEDFGKRFEGKGRTILYAVAALAVIIALIGIYYAWNRRSNAAAQAALGRAIQTSQAVVAATQPPGATVKSFPTEEARAQAAIAQFQEVVDKYGSPYEEKAKYFIAVNKLRIKRAEAVQELEALSQLSGEVGALSKFSLAQAKTDEGQLDQAAALYQELAGMDKPVVAKETINFELARIYEKQGKTAEAADLYFNIAKAAAEAKDLEGNAVPINQTAREAKEKLQELNPERAKELPETAPEPGLPFGM